MGMAGFCDLTFMPRCLPAEMAVSHSGVSLGAVEERRSMAKKIKKSIIVDLSQGQTLRRPDRISSMQAVFWEKNCLPTP
jgi:hypothetical protein